MTYSTIMILVDIASLRDIERAKGSQLSPRVTRRTDRPTVRGDGQNTDFFY